MQIFAHRGASADAPENTLYAIELALEQGADGIELDLFQVDDEFLVIHDQWLHRTTNGKGRLQDHSLTQLLQFDAGFGQHIPTLKQVIKLVRGKCLLNLEVKGIRDPECLLEHIDEASIQHQFTEQQFIVSSFDHHVIHDLKMRRPSLKIGALTASKPLDYAAFAQALGAYSVNLDVSFIDQAFLADAKARGLKVMVYTVDQPEELKLMQDWGVDAVFCNGPGKAREALK